MPSPTPRRRRIRAPLLLLALAVGVVAACRGRTPSRADAGTWTALLAPPRVQRLRAALLVEARDCPGALAAAEWFAEPGMAAAVDAVTIVVRDGRDSLERYADALLTAPVHLAVVPVPPRLRDVARRLGPGPRLVLVDPRGQVAWAVRLPLDPAALAATRRAALTVTDLYVSTELAHARTRP